MEVEVVQTLEFKLLPDTLYFWFDLAVQLWDIFVRHEAAHLGCHLFKPPETRRDVMRYQPGFHLFQLGQPNPYRVAVQALDLMSLHFKFLAFSRPMLILAVLALVHVSHSGLLQPYHCLSPGQLQEELTRWAELMEEGPDDYCHSFELFLRLYCKALLPENFNLPTWPRILAAEMQFACQFFTLAPQFREPLGRQKKVLVRRRDGTCEQRWVEEWLSLEHYSTAHQYTHQA